ncbi:MAG TPA: (d)CMP kinase [Bacillota bacterium]|nr:(d)CMP kinase [Bacillota bacterium]HOR85358.1 (d)CMP kinase [Bacillota bacterium]
MDNKVIAIDGPAGAGKSTIAKMLARSIGYTYIDSGAMYRAITLKVLRENIPLERVDIIINLTEETDIDFMENSIYLDGKVVDKEIREENVNMNVSYVSAIPGVRRLMVAQQRKISQDKNVVMDGRDVGTVIFPSADIKLFITASVDERAKRRFIEMEQKGYDVEIQDIKLQIEKRDHIDSTRSDSPLKAAFDSIIIDTTGKNIEEVFNEVISIVKSKGGGIDAL